MKPKTTAFMKGVMTFSQILFLTSVTFCNASMIIESPKVFCYGDSLTTGTSPPQNKEYPYAKHLQEKLRTMPGLESSRVGWKGYPGWTSSQLLNSSPLPSLLDDVHSKIGALDVVIILAGSNDLAYGTDSQEIFDTITGIHDIAHSKGCKTIALSIPPSGWQKQSDSARSLANSVNSKLENWSKENELQTMFVQFPITEFDASSGFWCSDGLHFSPDGYKKIGESLVPFVTNIVNK
mmetsp:Transcript_10573/g.12112  ORF Transcript_10573/g.12112 Transcript_10573/m.12112 type:complete len:236 (-) Transcript_10573:56-763(-)